MDTEPMGEETEMPAAPALSDEDLIPGLVAREEAAVAALLERYWGRAYRVALQLTGDPASAEDAAQETFVRLLDKAGQFQAGRAFRPWFFKILVNAARKQLRGATRRTAHEERAPQASPLAPDHAVEAAEATALVRAHLSELSPKLRAALSLRYLEELSLVEVAEALGIPQGTVSSRIRRGLESLRESLQPALQLGSVGGVEWLRRALEAGPAAPAAPGAGEIVAGLLDLPLGPLLDAPTAPSPSDLIHQAQGLAGKAGKVALGGATAATAVKAGGISRGPLVAMTALLLTGVAGSAWLLTEPLSAPAATPLAVSPTLPSPVAVVGDPELALLLPERLTVGDELEAVLVARWPGGDADALAPRLSVSSAEVLELRSGGGERERTDDGVRFPTTLVARAPGLASLVVELEVPGRRPARLERALQVIPAGRAVTLVSNVELQGPEAEAQVRLPARAGQLKAPRRLELRVLPGLAAEAELSLEGFARTPTGCFEQTTAATYPSALVLELAGQDADVDPSLLQRAQRCAEAGAQRLRRFQHPDGGFSLHPGRPTRLWLTAVGLQQLVQLGRVTPVERSRVQATARALLAWQAPDGHFEPERAQHVSAPSTLALTGYALAALAHEGVTADAEALGRGFEWLRARLTSPAARGTYELALAARALLVVEDEALAAELARALAARAAVTADDRASWSPDPGEVTFTGTLGDAATTELTGLVVQVLARTGHDDLALRGLAWLAGARTERGFGGTQATIQALEAFRVAGQLRAADGQLEVAVGGSPLPVVHVSPQDSLLRLALGSDVDAAVGIERGVDLRYQGHGTLRAQLALHGSVAWDAPGWSDGELQVRSDVLSLRVVRPGTARVGVPQTWQVRVANLSDEVLGAPMLEVSLPPGFVLAEGPRELEALTEGDEPPLQHYELLAGRLVLYLRDLAPGERLSLGVALLPTVAGRFAGGALWAYPYYQRAPGLEARGAPDQLRVLPARSARPAANVTESTPTGSAPTARPGPSAVAPDASPPAPGPVVADAAPPAVETVRIAWDAKLGPLTPGMLDLPLGRGPLEQLLGRALLRGLPSVSQVREVRPDQVYEFELTSAVWSDGTPVTVDDYLVTWEQARGLFVAQEEESVYRRTEARILHTMKVQVLDARRLRIALPAPAPGLVERLDRWPFLPRHRLASGRERLTNGLWRLTAPERGRLVLEGPGPRVVIEEVGERPGSGYDLAFVQPSRADPPPPSAGLYTRWMPEREYSATLAVLFPGSLEQLVGDGVIQTPDLERRYPRRRVGFAREIDAGLAQGLAIQLREAGREIDLSEAPTRRRRVDLWVGPPLTEGESLDDGRYFALTTGSRHLRGVDRRPNPDAADGAAFVRWPLRWGR